eukprot:scaffold592586_cov34-Prasinocladus_malaysianus.AAC.1
MTPSDNVKWHWPAVRRSGFVATLSKMLRVIKGMYPTCTVHGDDCETKLLPRFIAAATQSTLYNCGHAIHINTAVVVMVSKA